MKSKSGNIKFTISQLIEVMGGIEAYSQATNPSIVLARYNIIKSALTKSGVVYKSISKNDVLNIINLIECGELSATIEVSTSDSEVKNQQQKISKPVIRNFSKEVTGIEGGSVPASTLISTEGGAKELVERLNNLSEIVEKQSVIINELLNKYESDKNEEDRKIRIRNLIKEYIEKRNYWQAELDDDDGFTFYDLRCKREIERYDKDIVRLQDELSDCGVYQYIANIQRIKEEELEKQRCIDRKHQETFAANAIRDAKPKGKIEYDGWIDNLKTAKRW